MRYLLNNVACQGLAVVLAVVSLTSNARANVYATNLKINGGTTNASVSPGQSVSLSYILNEAASSGVNVKILSGATPIRTISIASGNPGTIRGLNTVTWNGKTDGGTNVPGGTYGFSVTASATGYSVWTQTTTNSNPGNQAWAPWGIAVNQNTNSQYYGRVFVANLATGPNPETNPADRLGFQKLNADASPADEGIFSDGGYAWVDGVFSPFRVRVGADDRFYAENWAQNGVVMSWDQQINTNSILYVMRDDNNPGGTFPGYAVTGTGANRKMWMTDANQGGTGFGVRVWNFLTNGVLATNDLGTTAVPITNVGLDDSAYDVAVDQSGRIYVICQPSFDSQFKIMRFPAYTGTPLTNADWRVDNISGIGNNWAIAVNPAATYVAVAQSVGNSVAILDAATGTNVTSVSANGNPHRAVAWDNVGNLYTAFDTPSGESLWQAWSPPGTNTATTVGVESIQIVAPPVITSIVPSGSNFIITFTGPSGDAPSAYTLLSGSAVTGITNVASAIMTGGSGVYQATVAASGPIQFYRIKR